MAKNNKQTAGQDGVSKMVTLGSKKFIAQQLLCDCRRYLFQQLILYIPRTYVIFYRHLSRIFQRFHLYRCASSSVSVGLSSLILPSSMIFS